MASTPQEREAVIALVEKARQNSDLHSPGSNGFNLKVSFTASGNVAQTGAGHMEETWLQPFAFRWTVNLGNYSLTRISANQSVFDNRPVGPVPMRVHMLRSAIFWPISFQPGHTLIRTATANWKGKQVTCVLTSGEMSDATDTPGRRWVEREFCVDSKTGLLQILSDAPGVYEIYDYSKALQFHGRTLPGQISVIEGGKSVLEAHLDGIQDASGTAADLLPVPDRKGHFPALMLGGTLRFPRVFPVAPGANAVQPVMVHAIIGEGGRVTDAELVEGEGGALGDAALGLVKQSVYPVENSRMRRQYEAYINVKFVSE